MLKFIRNITAHSIYAIILLCVGCAANNSRPVPVGDMDSLAGLRAMGTTKHRALSKQVSMGKVREMGLKEQALSLGAQSGLANRAKLIDDQLTKQQRRLDEIYDFNALLIEHNVLPPVLLEGQNTFNLATEQSIRISDRTYKIAKQARFVTTPPNWRQYLWMDYTKPDYPNISLLPKTSEEREVWNHYVEQGWEKGIEQADRILEESVARIKEDFRGMILYRKLLAMNMVSPPFVSHTDLGVTGDGDEIRIDDRVLRITALPALNVNSKEWRAPVQIDRDALKQFRQMERLIRKEQVRISSNSWQPIIDPDKK
jgi:defect-in-organelle-trafficking protein DotC